MTDGKAEYIRQVESLFKDGRLKRYPKNQIIAYQGDTLSAIHLIKGGYIKAYTILDSGDTRTMFILGEGDLFPIAFSMSTDWENHQVRYFYQTLTDTELLMLDQAHFKEQVTTDPAKGNIYMSYMGASNGAIMNQLEIMKNKTAKNKVELLLPYLISKLGEQVKPKVYQLKLKLSHQEIADLSGITRETTTALLKELEKDGVIEQKRNTWIIHADHLPESDDVFLG